MPGDPFMGPRPTTVPERILVVGFARTGRAVARELAGRGVEVRAVDDRPETAGLAEAARIGIELLATPSGAALDDLARWAGLVVVSPGVPPVHPVFGAAAPGSVVSEVELAFLLGGPPIVAITGTNGKTTVTSLVADMLARSGRSVRAAGNIGHPLVAAVGEPGLDLIVAEVSSFQLALTRTFRPKVATWLNLAEDHLDWHADYGDYGDAKARIWANQGADDVAVANAEDPGVMARTRPSAARLVTFGAAAGDFCRSGDDLVGPDGRRWAGIADLVRTMPHDVANALAAIATASAGGALPSACCAALAHQGPLAHRVELVGQVGGIDYFDDSKATTPSAVAAALAGFSSVVLVAGGRNKGLDLTAIAEAVRDADAPEGAPVPAGAPRRPRLRGVVAIGEAAAEIVAAFSPRWPVVEARSMSAAVAEASRLAEPGDAVLLSPGCASFDWYGSYEQRGDDFARCVRALAHTTIGRT